MIIPARYNGPPASANGGYACALVAAAAGGDVEVTLRRPPPLERELDVVPLADGRFELRDGETVVAEAAPVAFDVAVPAPVSLAAAERAAESFAGFRHHAYPTCFTCGPARDDGLGVFAGPVEGRAVVAAPWTPAQEPPPEIVWAALDCPGGWAVDDFQREGVLLGRMAARLGSPPAAGEPHVVLGWAIGADGRKRYAGSAVTTAAGDVLAVARSTWIVPQAAAA